MLQHIIEGPALIRGLLNNRKAVTGDFCRIFLENNIRRVYFSGSGSPANACEVLAYFCKKLLGAEATCIIPTLFDHHQDFDTLNYLPEEILLICPAESGRTKGTVRVAERAASRGIHTACCTFNINGRLADLCDVALYKPSGREVALPSTKGHTMGIFIFLLCFVEAALATGKIEEQEYRLYIDELYTSAQCMEENVQTVEDWFTDNQVEVMDSGCYWFIGYGANIGTAKECALKFLECTRRPSLAYELEEFMHGPLAAVRPNDMVFFLMAETGADRSRMAELAQFCTRITERCVAVGADVATIAGLPLQIVTSGGKMGSTLELLQPMQLLAGDIAGCLGYDLTKHSKNSAGKAMKLSIEE